MTIGEAITLEGVPTERLEAQITELAGHLAAAECRWLELVAEFDRRKAYEVWGCMSCAYWLSWHCGLDMRSARDKVRVGACARGPAADSREVRGGMHQLLESAGDQPGGDPATEEDLVMLAEHSTGAQLERIVSAYRRGIDLEEERRGVRDRQREHVGDVLLG